MGTCFSIDRNGRQYFITAKHVISGLQDGNSVEIFYKGAWVKNNVKLIGHHQTQDVSVFALNQLIPAHPMEASSNGIAYGQDSYFLGFPYGLQDANNVHINRNFPLPLVKKATVSAILNDHVGRYMLLDGINNPGFSGGPVVFKKGNEKEFRVAGIISGFRFQNEPIYVNDNPQNQLTYRSNTGIIISPMIENATQLIDTNPIGFEINNPN